MGYGGCLAAKYECGMFFFFQAEDGIRDYKVTGVQTCALPICSHQRRLAFERGAMHAAHELGVVEFGRAMLGAAVVPQHGVAGLPAVPIDEARLLDRKSVV